MITILRDYVGMMGYNRYDNGVELYFPLFSHVPMKKYKMLHKYKNSRISKNSISQSA